MNRKIAFIAVNAILIVIVGLVGIFCKNIFNTGVGTAAFICLLVTLALPSFIYFVGTKGGLTGLVISTMLMVAELAINITFICLNNVDAKVFAIVQASVLGVFLIALLVFIGTRKKEA